MAEAFDPTAYPTLIALGQQLRELAGDAAYRAGRDYLRGGMIEEPTVSSGQALAAVKGSTLYRVSIAFTGAASKVTCTCPAHRRSKHCKHVVAVAAALLEQPHLFRIVEAAEIPVVAPPTSGRKRRSSSTTTAKQRADELLQTQRQAGLELVDRLLDDLTGTGLAGLGQEQLALLRGVAETVHGLKLRHLGNTLHALLRVVAEQGEEEATPAWFADLLVDIAITRRMIAASTAGEVTLEDGLAEELIGKTWRASELTPVTGLRLIALARESHDDGDFRVDSTYLIDVPTNELFVERQITPLGLRRARGEKPPSRRMLLAVDHAGVYPGASPRRIKLTEVRREPLHMDDVQHVVQNAVDEERVARRTLIDRFAVPVGASDPVVVFRPTGLATEGGKVVALDRWGRTLPLRFPDGWSLPTVRGLTVDLGAWAFLGMMRLAPSGPMLQCLSIVGDLHWVNGPTYPDVA